MVGRIVRAHGVRGEVTVDVRTDTPELRFAEGSVLAVERPVRIRPGLGPPPASLTVTRARWHQERLLVVFDGISDRTAAESLRGLDLAVDIPDDERPEDEEEYYDHQLVGLSVITVDGADVGEVVEVVHGPAQDMLVITRGRGRQLLVPFVSEIVPDVDVDAGRLVLDPPPGLLDLPESGKPAR